MNGRSAGKVIASWILSAIFVIMNFKFCGAGPAENPPVSVDYNQFLQMVQADKFQSVLIQHTQKGGNIVTGCCLKEKSEKDKAEIDKSYTVFTDDPGLLPVLK